MIYHRSPRPAPLSDPQQEPHCPPAEPSGKNPQLVVNLDEVSLPVPATLGVPFCLLSLTQAQAFTLRSLCCYHAFEGKSHDAPGQPRRSCAGRVWAVVAS
jgi:hypothetical protein